MSQPLQLLLGGADPATVAAAGEPTPGNAHAPSDHCAECCSDSACPRCWAEGAELVLEHVPLPSRS